MHYLMLNGFIALSLNTFIETNVDKILITNENVAKDFPNYIWHVTFIGFGV